jgi:hypothetical protein
MKKTKNCLNCREYTVNSIICKNETYKKMSNYMIFRIYKRRELLGACPRDFFERVEIS